MENTVDWSQEQWDNFRTWLEDLLRVDTVQIIFTKTDGTERTMLATKQQQVITPAIERKKIVETLNSSDLENVPVKKSRPLRNKDLKDGLILVWDIEADDWRTIKVKKILNILTLILKYEYREPPPLFQPY